MVSVFGLLESARVSSAMMAQGYVLDYASRADGSNVDCTDAIRHGATKVGGIDSAMKLPGQV